MMKATKPPASTYARSNAHGLTLTQQNAIDLLAAGKNDTDTAAVLELNRVTVTRWRLYSPGFRAALADQRAAIWGASADRLRALLPKALDALTEALEEADQSDRVAVALGVLKLAGPLPLVPNEPPDAEEILRRGIDPLAYGRFDIPAADLPAVLDRMPKGGKVEPYSGYSNVTSHQMGEPWWQPGQIREPRVAEWSEPGFSVNLLVGKSGQSDILTVYFFNFGL